MAYLVKAGVGLALFFGGLVLFNVTLQELREEGALTKLEFDREKAKILAEQ